MKVEVWPEHGPLNSKHIFKKFIKSLQDAGDECTLIKKAMPTWQ